MNILFNGRGFEFLKYFNKFVRNIELKGEKISKSVERPRTRARKCENIASTSKNRYSANLGN